MISHFSNSKTWANEAVVVSSPCGLVTAGAVDKSGAGFWLLIYDAGTDKETGNPIAVLAVPASSQAFLDYRDIPRPMRHGIYMVASSDPVTKTPIATQDAFFICSYATFPKQS